MWLQLRLYMLLGVMFAIVFGIVSLIARSAGISNLYFYLAFALGMTVLQYMIGPKVIEWTMGIKYVSDKQEPKLHRMVEELAKKEIHKGLRSRITAEQAKVLLEFKADPNRRNITDKTPLHYAKTAEITKALLDAGANPSAIDDFGKTPLYYAETEEQKNLKILLVSQFLSF